MKIKDILQIKYGKNQSSVIDENGKYPIIGTGGIFGYATKYLYNKPSVLIGRKGSINNPMYVDTPFWTVDTLFYTIIDTSKVIPRWFYYYISTLNLNKFNEGTTIPSLTTKTLYEIDVPEHSLNYQQHIVDIIGSLDDKIESNNKLLEKCYIFLNLNMKKLLIGKDKKIISSFDDIEIISSGIDKFNSSKIYLDTSCVSDNSIVDISNKVTYTDRPSRANMKPIKNSVWFAKLKSSPKHIIVKDYSDEILDNCIFSTGFLGIKIDNLKFNLLSTYFTSDVFEKEKDSLSIGATMQSINNVTFKGMYIPDFSPTDYIIFNNLSEPILKLIYETELENIKLQQLKLNYLTKFF